MISKVYRPFLYSTKQFNEYLRDMLMERKVSRRRRGKVSQLLQEEVLDLHKRGFSIRKITERTGVNKSTVGRLVKGQGE
jgi:transposase-like protein